MERSVCKILYIWRGVYVKSRLFNESAFPSNQSALILREVYFLGQVIKAWDQGVATMRKGELAVFTCKSEYAYGDKGSPPIIPPNATLIFEVELLYWEGEDISPDKDQTIMRSIQKEGDKFETPNDGSMMDGKK